MCGGSLVCGRLRWRHRGASISREACLTLSPSRQPMILLSDGRLSALMSSSDLAQVAGAAAPLSSLTDDELVARARAKDVAAFEELIGRHEEKVYRLAMRFTRNETDAAEILQETFLSAW